MVFFYNIIVTIRNAAKASLLYTVYPIPIGSPMKNIRSMLNILRKNGVIRGFSFWPITNKVIIYLKYDETGKSNLNTLYFVSKPGRRVHISSNALWQSRATAGFFVMSTIYGILTDVEARRFNVGGIVLFGIN